MAERLPGSRTSDYEFHLPEHQIAQFPEPRRDASRLLVLRRENGEIEHRHFLDLADLVPTGDVLVLNETRVFPARLVGRRAGGGSAEILLLHPEEDERDWTALVRPGAKLKPGRIVTIGEGVSVEVLDVLPGGERRVRLHLERSLDEVLQQHGQVPLPAYMGRIPEADDRERYQTVYARARGSVAAPTAGLHFTPELLDALEARGVKIARLVLHVGVGTFRPVEVDDPAAHAMHREWYEVAPAAAALINEVRAAGGSIWAVGTTSARTLETVADDRGTVHPGTGWTDIFIHPPYRFRAVDHLLTNFHLPRSTLIMLVAALAGHATTMAAYQTAVEEGYRFYSYGDAMLVTR